MYKWQYKWQQIQIKILRWWYDFKEKHVCKEYPHEDVPFMWDDDGYVP